MKVFLLRCNGALIEVFSTEDKALDYMRQHRKNGQFWRIEDTGHGRSLERAFGRRNHADGTRVEFNRGTQSATKRLEHGFGLVVRVFAAQIVDVQGHESMVDEALKKFKCQLRVEMPDHAAFERHVHFQTWAA